MDFLAEWFDTFRDRAEITWDKTVSVEGTCDAHTGPGIRFASVTIEFSPCTQFTVEERLNSDTSQLIHERDWYRFIIFGVLDVMMTMPNSPIRNYKMVITHIEFNEIESTQIAFRLAARDAARKALQNNKV